MRTLIAVLVLVSAAASAAASPARPAAPADAFRLVFLEGDAQAPVRRGGADDATIDVGRLAAARCPSRGCLRTVVRRQFRLRVDGVATTARFVRTRAYLQSDVPGHRVRLDGRLLTAGPQLIDAMIPIGTPVAHTLEIEVPISEPAGMLAESIVWVAEDVQ
jgi:hypothetical protein